jgi:hypothetical protein
MPVYFIQAGDAGPIKIGHTNDVRKRLSMIQTSAPDHLRLLAVMDGGEAEERALHRELTDFRRVGEWFDPSPEVMGAVSRGRPVNERRHRKQRADTSVDRFVIAFGGTTATARLFGVLPSAVSNWRRADRFPDRLQLRVVRECERRGIEPPAFDLPPEREAA